MKNLRGEFHNPHAITKADTIVGIPSYNEADSIGFVVSQTALGLAQCSTADNSVIINADNDSPDGTRGAFLAADSGVIPTIYCSTPEGVTGKGTNIRNLLEIAKEFNARRLFLIDADLKSIEPHWIYAMLQALDDGNDLIVPLYQRNEYDGTITNHICYPLIRGAFQMDVRQPIGGEFGLSSRMVAYLLDLPWIQTTYEYGIDIFLTLGALLENFNVGQVHLGTKIHKPSAPKLGPMFRQVVETLFSSLNDRNRSQWLHVKAPHRELRTYGTPNPALKTQHLAIDYKAMREQAVIEFSTNEHRLRSLLPPNIFNAVNAMVERNYFDINHVLWAETLYHALHQHDEATGETKAEIINAFAALWIGRSISFIRETLDLDHDASEEKIREQARYFEDNRSLLLAHYAK